MTAVGDEAGVAITAFVTAVGLAPPDAPVVAVAHGEMLTVGTRAIIRVGSSLRSKDREFSAEVAGIEAGELGFESARAAVRVAIETRYTLPS